jgi:hypothetical protein
LQRQLAAAGQIGTVGSQLGSLTDQQQNAILSGGQAVSGAQQSGNTTQLAGASQYGQLGAQLGSLTAQQQSLLASMGSTAGSLAGTDQTRQLSALNQLAGTAQQTQGMRAADAASLEAAGQAQQNNVQQQLTAAQQQYMNEQNYAKQQADWMNAQIRGIAPTVPVSTTQTGSNTGGSYSASPLSQLATGLYTYKGLNSLG